MKKIILLLMVFTAQFQLVFGQITITNGAGCAPLTGVTFSSPLPGDWDFGNGTSAENETSGSAIYQDPGTYYITLDDGSNNYLDSVIVYENPTPDFGLDGSTSGCVPFSVDFSDSSVANGTTIVDWEWTFGDGGGSSQQNPNYTYTLTGEFDVTLIVTDGNGCDSTEQKTTYISVSNPPSVSFSASPTTACDAPLTVAINNNSTNSTGGTDNLTYEWDFGDGQTSSDANPGSHEYTAQGAYVLSLTITEDGGCSRTQTRNVNIGKPTAEISVADTICHNISTQFFNASSGGSSYSWDFAGLGTSGSEDPFFNFNVSGDQDVTLIVSGGGCADTTTKTVYVQELQPTLTSTPTYQCDEPYCVQFTGGGDNIINWSYDFGDGAGSNEQSPEHCYTFGGNEYTVYYNEGYTYQGTLTGYSIHGCQASTVVVDTIFPISANFAPNITQGCAPLTVEFEDSSASGSTITSYEYIFGDGNTANTENATNTFAAAGEYDVRLVIENENGCRDTSFPIQVQVGTDIDLDVSVSSSTVCIGDTVFFADANGDARIDGFHFSTDENRGSEGCPTDSLQYWTYFHETGTHDVTFQADYNGCITEEVFASAVTVNGPSSEFRWSGLCEDPTNITFTATAYEVDSLYWYFGDDSTHFSDDLADTIYTHRYDTTGDYNVTLISTNASSGCPNDTSVMEVNVRMLQAIIDADTLICSGGFIPYGGLSVDAAPYQNCNNTYRWDWGDGSEMRLQDQPYFNTALSDTGTYTLRLMVYDINGCRDTAEQEIVVTDIYAGFTADTTTGCLPLTINFTDTSWSASNLVSWEYGYDFVTYDTNQNGQITFNQKNRTSYTVKLVVTDELGCVDSTTMPITPILPDTNFSVSDQTICVGDEVTFTFANQGAVASANWDFGGQGSSMDVNPDFEFNNQGDYNISVTLTDTNGCPGTRTYTELVRVDSFPIARFSMADEEGAYIDENSVICYPEKVTFTDTSHINFGVTTFLSREWDLNLGSPGNYITNASVDWPYNEPGDYAIQLIETSTNGCRDTLIDTLTIVGPVANIVLDKNIICVDEEITMDIDTDSSDVWAYIWSYGDGKGSDTTYISDVSSAAETNQYTFVPEGGTSKVQLIVYSENFACDYPLEESYQVHEVEANFGFEDSTVCSNVAVVFGDTSVTSASGTTREDWYTPVGDFVGVPGPLDFSSVAPGSYDITLILTNEDVGCADTMVRELTILEPPTISSTDAIACLGGTTTITASGGETYAWDDTFGDMATPNNASSIVTPVQNGNYPVTGYINRITGNDTSVCAESASSNITVIEETPPEETRDCAIIGQNFTLGIDYGAAFTYNWSPNDYLPCTTCPINTFNITEEVDSVVYTVNITDTMGCFPFTNTYTICIIDNYTVDVPSAFTPDGAGENNVVYVNGHGIDELIYFRIYNRWGELVFETDDINVGWDGTYKGNAQDMETFVYQAKVRFFTGKFEEKGGEITLIR